MESGVDLVKLGKTPAVMTNIVLSEFGIDVKFEIRSGADVTIAREEFFKLQNKELDRLRQEAAESAVSAARPTKQEGGQQEAPAEPLGYNGSNPL